jgi:hypothetical protein
MVISPSILVGNLYIFHMPSSFRQSASCFYVQIHLDLFHVVFFLLNSGMLQCSKPLEKGLASTDKKTGVWPTEIAECFTKIATVAFRP